VGGKKRREYAPRLARKEEQKERKVDSRHKRAWGKKGGGPIARRRKEGRKRIEDSRRKTSRVWKEKPKAKGQTKRGTGPGGEGVRHLPRGEVTSK